jgi:hypothetical protein
MSYFARSSATITGPMPWMSLAALALAVTVIVAIAALSVAGLLMADSSMLYFKAWRESRTRFPLSAMVIAAFCIGIVLFSGPIQAHSNNVCSFAQGTVITPTLLSPSCCAALTSCTPLLSSDSSCSAANRNGFREKNLQSVATRPARCWTFGPCPVSTTSCSQGQRDRLSPEIRSSGCENGGGWHPRLRFPHSPFATPSYSSRRPPFKDETTPNSGSRASSGARRVSSWQRCDFTSGPRPENRSFATSRPLPFHARW